MKEYAENCFLPKGLHTIRKKFEQCTGKKKDTSVY